MATTKPTPEEKAAIDKAAADKAEKAAADKAAKEADKAAATAKEADEVLAKATTDAEEAKRKNDEAQAKADVATAEAPVDVVDLDVVSADIRRDEVTTIPVTVFAHELPILKRLYGDSFVKERSRRKQKVAGFDANTELGRLKRKYKVAGANPSGDDVVSTVYRDGRELAREAGVKFSDSVARAPTQSVQKPARKDKVIGANR